MRAVELNQVMSGLEAFSGELACQRITPAELDQIKALHYAMLVCRAQNDLPGYYSRNHCCPVKSAMASPRASIGAGLRPI